MPQQSSAGRNVADHYLESAGAEYFARQQADAEKKNGRTVEWFRPFVDEMDVVVDYGCGTGWLLKLLPSATKIGFEPNPLAREYADQLGIRTVGSSEEIESSSADVVVSNHAIEHSRSPFTELLEIRRILKPSGRLVLGLPIDDWRRQRKPDPEDPNHHLFTWTPQLLSNLLDDAGFDVETLRMFAYHRPPRYWLYGKVPLPVYDLMSNLYGRIRRSRQIIAVAVPRDDPRGSSSS